MMLSKIEWEPIIINKKAYPYYISNTGVVRNSRGEYLTPFKRGKHKGVYHAVDLYVHGKRKRIDIQRLVAEAFIRNPYNKPEVNHLDLDHYNNNVENLEWVTRSENMQHAHFMRGCAIIEARL